MDCPPEARVQRPRALIVDDDARFVAACRLLLEEDGLQVETCATADEALDRLARDGADVVLCGLPMREGSAAKLFEQLGGGAQPPAILFVAPNDEDQAAVALRVGGWTVLYKPLDPAQLSRTVAWCLGVRHARHNLAPGQQEALYRMSSAANHEPTMQQAMDNVLQVAIGAVKADTGSILLTAPPPAPRTLVVTCSYGLAPEQVSRVREFGEGAAGWVALHQRPLRVVGRLEAYPQFQNEPAHPEVAESLLAPIQFRNETLGVLCLTARTGGRFGAQDLALAQAAADVLAAAVSREQTERSREHQDRLALLGRLAASVAHELRNPLAHLKSSLDYVWKEAVEETGPSHDVRSAFEEMRDSVDRMTELLEHLRTSSRKSNESAELVQPEVLLHKTVALVRPQLKHRVQLQVEAGKAPEIRMQPGRILQVLINLVMNASQALEGVPREARIVLRTRFTAGRVHFEVEDNGLGMNPEVASHVFQPFFTTKSEEDGTGLGLSISRQIAHEHGGELDFRTEPGNGCVFTLSLPAPEPELAPDPATSPHTGTAPAQRKGRPRILVVDDDPLLVRALTRSLRGHFDVTAAVTATEALQSARGSLPEAVVTDFNMPEMTGVMLARELRKAGMRFPIAILSAAPTVPEIEQALREGLVQAVWGKPWLAHSLMEQLRALIRS